MVVYPRVSTRLTELTTSTRPLEAMAMERPVIASGVGGMAELIRHGKTGYLVETDSRTTLAAWILRLAGQRAGRLMVGVNARAFVVEHHDWDRVAERYVKLYSPLLAKGSSPPSPETVAAGWPDERVPEPHAESYPKQY
jgi:glycosyltransferase involved in cell wall biosynthesis